MGEQDIAVYFKNKALNCVNESNGLDKKDLKIQFIENCFLKTLGEIFLELNETKARKLEKNINEQTCIVNENSKDCVDRMLKSWWN